MINSNEMDLKAHSYFKNFQAGPAGAGRRQPPPVQKVVFILYFHFHPAQTGAGRRRFAPGEKFVFILRKH